MALLWLSTKYTITPHTSAQARTLGRKIWRELLLLLLVVDLLNYTSCHCIAQHGSIVRNPALYLQALHYTCWPPWSWSMAVRCLCQCHTFWTDWANPNSLNRGVFERVWRQSIGPFNVHLVTMLSVKTLASQSLLKDQQHIFFSEDNLHTAAYLHRNCAVEITPLAHHTKLLCFFAGRLWLSAFPTNRYALCRHVGKRKVCQHSQFVAGTSSTAFMNIFRTSPHVFTLWTFKTFWILVSSFVLVSVQFE